LKRTAGLAFSSIIQLLRSRSCLDMSSWIRTPHLSFQSGALILLPRRFKTFVIFVFVYSLPGTFLRGLGRAGLLLSYLFAWSSLGAQEYLLVKPLSHRSVSF